MLAGRCWLAEANSSCQTRWQVPRWAPQRPAPKDDENQVAGCCAGRLGPPQFQATVPGCVFMMRRGPRDTLRQLPPRNTPDNSPLRADKAAGHDESLQHLPGCLGLHAGAHEGLLHGGGLHGGDLLPRRGSVSSKQMEGLGSRVALGWGLDLPYPSPPNDG